MDNTETPGQPTEETGRTFSRISTSEVVATMTGCVDRSGNYYRPTIPEELQIILYTKDGRSWKANWIPNYDALPR